MKHFLILALAVFGAFIGWYAAAQTPVKPLQVCATVPELGSLVREIGGTHVEVTVFAKGTEDPHFIDAKPSFITQLSKADLFVAVGMELEVGWAPVLLQNARNGKVLPGSPGYLEASRAISPLEIPKGIIDRAMGDVHPAGNPHFLLDPLNGLSVARLIRDRLIELRPAERADFDKNYASFAQKLGGDLFGDKLAAKYPVEKLAILESHHKLDDFLKQQHEQDLLEGWLGTLKPYAGTKVIVDHNMWPYFANRFDLVIAGSLEPKPGVQPTTRHLQAIIAMMKESHIHIVLTASYYDPRHARFVAENSGATVVAMAHQSGARAGSDGYLDMINYDVQQLKKALAS